MKHLYFLFFFMFILTGCGQKEVTWQAEYNENYQIHINGISYDTLEDIKEVPEEVKGINLSGIVFQDTEKLKEFTNVEELILLGCSIDDFSFVKEMPSLHFLHLGGVSVDDFSFLQDIPNLKTLYLTAMSLEDISFLSSLTQLEDLNISHNEIKDISPLATLTKLKRLSMIRNHIDDISAVANMKELEILMFQENTAPDTEEFQELLCDLAPLEGLTNLQLVTADHAQISPEDEEKFTNLLELD